MALTCKPFGDIITFTRASTATYFDSAGVLQSAAIDAPRFDYDPSTLAARGFLIEESRTNSIRNNTAQGAVAGTPGTLPTNWQKAEAASLVFEVVGTGTENGITYVDIKLSGTASSTSTSAIQFEQNSQIAASLGQTWSVTSYVKITAGSTSGLSTVNIGWEERAAAFLAVNQSIISPQNGGNLNTGRVSHTGTNANASTTFVKPYINFTPLNGAAIDITLRIGLPQLELGAFATSAIPTTTTALTRSADEASVNTLSPWYNATASTIYAEWSRNAVIPSGVFPRAVDLIESATTQKISINHLDNQTSTTSQAIYPSGLSWPFTSVVVNPTVGVKTALAFQVGSGRYAVNGSLGGADFSVASIPAFDQLILGAGKSFPNNSRLNGYLRRITYYPRRLSNAELQAITT